MIKRSKFNNLFFLTSVLCFFQLFSLNAQTLKPFTISGDVSKVKERIKKVMIFYKIGQRKYADDSCLVINGKYAFKGKIQDGRQAYLTAIPAKKSRSNQQDFLRVIYLEPAAITLKSDSIYSNMKVTGSKGQADFDQWEDAKPFRDKIDSLYTLYMSVPPPYPSKEKAIEDSIAREKGAVLIKLYKKKLVEFNLQYAKEHMASPVILEILAAVYLPEFETEQEKLFNMIPQHLKKTQTGEEMAAGYAIKPGKIGADFTLPDTSGKNITLSSLRGKYVLLDFWASWCVPCRKENPYLVKAFNQHKENFTIMSVSFDYANGRENWLQAIKNDNIGMWTHVSSLSGFNSVPGKLYGRIDGIPANFLLDKNGKIIAKNIKGEDLEKKLEELLK